MFQRWPAGFGVAIFLVGSVCIFAQPPSDESERLEDLSLAELLNLNISLASKSEEPVSEAPSIVAVITAQDIENMGARNFEDILRQVPGFDVVLNPTASNLGISVRGVLSTNATNNQVKFLINGHHVHSIVGGGPHHYLDYLPVHNILKIEIIRGPGSALYGANAFSAVINIITRGVESSSQLSMDVGSHDTYRPSLLWSTAVDEFQVALSASQVNTDGNEGFIASDSAALLFGDAFTAAPGHTTQGAENFTFQADVGYRGFKLTGLYNKLEKDYAIGVANALTDENQLDVEAGFTELSYTHDLSSGKGQVSFRTYYDFFNFAPKFEIFSEETAQLFNLIYNESDPFPEGVGIVGQPGVDFYLMGAEVTAKYDLKPGIQVLGGLLYDYSKIFNPTHLVNSNVSGQPLTIGNRVYGPFEYIGPLVDISNIPGGNWISTGDRTNVAGYVQARLDFRTIFEWSDNLESFALTLGLRHDDYSDIGNSTNPRIGLVFSPNKKVFFKGLYGESFRAPTFDELYQINNPSFEGNPDLQPQSLSTRELQIGTNYSENWIATLSFFDTKIENIINLVDNGDPEVPGNEFMNFGQIRAKGIEVDAKYAFNSQRYFYMNYTYQKAENTTNTDISMNDSSGAQVQCQQPDYPVGNVPRSIFNLGLNVDPLPRMNWNTTLNYTGSRERNGRLAFTPDPASIQSLEGHLSCQTDRLALIDQRPPTPSRVLVNTSLFFDLKKGIQLRLSGYNLLDEDHRDPDNSQQIRDDVPRAGTTFQVSLRYRY